MNAIHQTLTALSAGEISVEEALLKIRKEPFESIGYANVDTHRAARQGVPEVVYGANKTKEQLLGILRAMMAAGQEVSSPPISPPRSARMWQRDCRCDTILRPASASSASVPRPTGSAPFWW